MGQARRGGVRGRGKDQELTQKGEARRLEPSLHPLKTPPPHSDPQQSVRAPTATWSLSRKSHIVVPGSWTPRTPATGLWGSRQHPRLGPARTHSPIHPSLAGPGVGPHPFFGLPRSDDPASTDRRVRRRPAERRWGRAPKRAPEHPSRSRGALTTRRCALAPPPAPTLYPFTAIAKVS